MQTFAQNRHGAHMRQMSDRDSKYYETKIVNLLRTEPEINTPILEERFSFVPKHRIAKILKRFRKEQGMSRKL